MTDLLPHKPRGFAAMDAAKLQAIASLGGRKVPPAKRAFSQNRRLASEAGRKGGLAVTAGKRTFSLHPDIAVTAGREGGKALGPKQRSFYTHPGLASRAGKLGGSAPRKPRGRSKLNVT